MTYIISYICMRKIYWNNNLCHKIMKKTLLVLIFLLLSTQSFAKVGDFYFAEVFRWTSTEVDTLTATAVSATCSIVEDYSV